MGVLKDSHFRMHKSDSEIVTLCLIGQKGYFDELVHRYYRPLFGYIYNQVKDTNSAEDIVQEAFLRAYRSLEKCSKPEGFAGWLFTIAKNCMREWLRQNKEISTPQASLAQEIVTKTNNDKEEILDIMKNVLLELPDELRLVLSMKYQNNMSCQKIAVALGKPLGTVTSLLSRAYKTMRVEVIKHQEAE